MRVTEHLRNAPEPPISFEIIPPKRGGRLGDLLHLIEQLAEFSPPFIDITSHPAELVDVDGPAGPTRKMLRKRPGTLGLCALIQHKFGIDAVPHVLCTGFTREETEDFLIELHYLGVDNVLALRGDKKSVSKAIESGRTVNADALGLVEQIAALNRGEYLVAHPGDAAMDYCVGVAGYPEKHQDAASLEADIAVAKAKVDAGAEYIVTQMFYDNQVYFNYVEQCRAAGIHVPIIPGLKILTTRRHLEILPRIFGCALPEELVRAVEAAPDDAVGEVGVEWAVQQARDLLGGGAPSLHFYVMQSATAVSRVVSMLRRL